MSKASHELKWFLLTWAFNSQPALMLHSNVNNLCNKLILASALMSAFDPFYDIRFLGNQNCPSNHVLQNKMVLKIVQNAE